MLDLGAKKSAEIGSLFFSPKKNVLSSYLQTFMIPPNKFLFFGSDNI